MSGGSEWEQQRSSMNEQRNEWCEYLELRGGREKAPPPPTPTAVQLNSLPAVAKEGITEDDDDDDEATMKT